MSAAGGYEPADGPELGDNRPGDYGAGFFDELLGKRKRAPHDDTCEVAHLVAEAQAAIADGAKPGPRPRHCCRCTSLADKELAAGRPAPPVREVLSWRGTNGRLYCSGLCGDCTDYEWSAMWQRRYDAASEASNAKEMRKLVELCNEYARSQRRDGSLRRFYGKPTAAGMVGP